MVAQTHQWLLCRQMVHPSRRLFLLHLLLQGKLVRLMYPYLMLFLGSLTVASALFQGAFEVYVATAAIITYLEWRNYDVRRRKDRP